ncbi:MAG: tRNA (adenosine(37)-N6)-dimethylallyltransferase MiaA [Candidatus Omnitrophota bacterium]
MNKENKIVFILGPTAVGKTAVGIALAKKLNGEIISCDAMQVYDKIFIASNKPGLEEMNGVPHHLVGGISMDENFDVARFLKVANPLIDDILKRNRSVIVSGGTGMYARALLDGIFEIDDIPQEIGEQLEKEAREKGLDYLYQELSSVDQRSAARIHPHDERRILRALEVYRAAGVPISSLQETSSGLWGKRPVMIFGLDMDRDWLYERINARVEKMFEDGLIEEVAKIQGVEVSRTACAIIGLKEVGGYLAGKCTLQEAKEEMKKNTRRLAKRQLTWFRADQRIKWVLIGRDQTVEQITNQIIREVMNAG